uniref:Uncharacterized protein n=1 Tax=Oryza meridionalis TaxID=40149 RepID=A0A0E0F1Q6_9ORYZ
MNTVEEQERREEQGGRGTCAKSAPHPLVLTTMTDIVLAANKSSHPPTMYYIDEQAQQIWQGGLKSNPANNLAQKDLFVGKSDTKLCIEQFTVADRVTIIPFGGMMMIHRYSRVKACGCWPANAKEETWPSQGALIFLI